MNQTQPRYKRRVVRAKNEMFYRTVGEKMWELGFTKSGRRTA